MRGEFLTGFLPACFSACEKLPLTFRTVRRRQAFLKTFVQRIVECHEQTTAARSSLLAHDEYWVRVDRYCARRLESVILRPGEKEPAPRRRAVPKVERVLRPTRSALSPRVSVLRASWNRQDFAGVSGSCAVWHVDLYDHVGRLQRQVANEGDPACSIQFGHPL
jgi:hypothetical protein